MTISEGINHIDLFGNPIENFYSLGKRDKIAFSEVYDQISRLCVRNEFMAKIVKATTEFSTRFNKKNDYELYPELNAYAEGLERPFDDVLLTMLMPEMVASFNKWAPDLLSLIPGCSSLFVWDKKNNGVVHSRILDYALSGPFEKFERSVTYNFQGRNKIFSYGSAGIAFPGLTAMNDKGLTLALHYKHGSYFDLAGESIFLIATDLLFKCSTIREAIKLLRTKKSISFWGLYLSDKSGAVASIDICGPEVYQEIYDCKDYPFLYFNNRSLKTKPSDEEQQPFGSELQCNMRYDVLKKRGKLFKVSPDQDIMYESMSLLAAPAPNKKEHPANWKLSPVTPSSIQLCAFHNSLEKSYFVAGPAPKYFTGNYLVHGHFFEKLKSENKKKKAQHPDFIKGNQFISKYQSYLDKNQISHAYHSLQMAALYLKDLPEAHVIHFYFTVMEYIYESDKRDMSYLYQEFKNMEGLLPPYLNDHLILFLLRTSKLVGLKVENRIAEITHPELRELYRKEFNLNAIAIKGLKFLIFPRIEILDIIYAY